MEPKLRIIRKKKSEAENAHLDPLMRALKALHSAGAPETMTEEELEEEYKKIASGYNVDLEKVKESIPVSGITEDVVMRKAVELIKANAVKPAKKEAKKDTTKG